MDYADYKDKMRETTATAATSFEQLVNCGDQEYREMFVDRLCSMHRTLQQVMVGEVVIPIIREMANRFTSNRDMDGCNEYACKVCAAMLNGLEAEFPHMANGERHLPLV